MSCVKKVFVRSAQCDALLFTFFTQNASLSCALGVMCHGLLVAGHPTVTDMVDSLVTTWMSSVTDEVLSCVYGLVF